VAEWHWEPVTDDLLDGLLPAALAAVRQVAEEVTARESTIFLDRREFKGEPPGLRTVRRGAVMLVLHDRRPRRTRSHHPGMVDRLNSNSTGACKQIFESYSGFTMWGGWGSNPRPADYEKPGVTLRTRYLHSYRAAAAPIALIALIALTARSTNRSTTHKDGSPYRLRSVITGLRSPQGCCARRKHVRPSIVSTACPTPSPVRS
jgi:hypothetical protein